MQFKEPVLQQELDDTPIFLQIIAYDLDNFCVSSYSKEIMITRVLEFIKGDSGVHEHHLAFDVRDESNGKFYFTDDEKKEITDYLNTRYERFDGKPTALFHCFGTGPVHLHVQISEYMSTYIKKTT